MSSGLAGLFALCSAVVLLAGCEDPLEPSPGETPIETQGGPRPGTDPQAWAASDIQINLSWPDNSNSESGWEVHRSTTGAAGDFSLLVQTGANVTTHSDVGLTPLTEYCYRFRSFKINGKRTTFTAFSTVTCARTFGPPDPASGLSAKPAPFGAVDLVWNTNSFTTDGFQLERSGGAEGPWVLLKTFPGWQRSYRDDGRATEEEVCYRVIAFNAYGKAVPSNVDCTKPPAAPTDLAAKSPDEQSIALSWKDQSGFEDGFEVQRAGDDLVWSVIATLPPDDTTYTDRSLPVDTRFHYQVRATKDGGFSQFSNVASTATASRPPDAPSFIVATPDSSSAVTVYWATDSKLAVGYRLERSADRVSWTEIPTVAGQYWFEDQGLTSEEEICYRAVAFNRVGEASNMTCTTPPAAPTKLETVVVDDQTVEHRWQDNSDYEDGYELWLYYCDEWDCYYYSVSLPPNTQPQPSTMSYQASSSEAVYGVVALKDGGYSDWAFPSYGITAAAMRNAAGNARRPPASARRTPPTSRNTTEGFTLR